MISRTMLAISIAGAALAQPAKIDFGRDVLPIFRQNCIGCHGPSQQLSGLRLDRKSSAFKDGFRRVVPGSSQNSFLYHRLIGNEMGPAMPPSGPLRPEQIAIIKAWIDQGADWPDSLSNEAGRAPLDPKAIASVETLRGGDAKGFMQAMSADPDLINARGPEGSTPFMYAALYGDHAMLEELLKKGAKPNLKNDANATALMWAATDLEKTRVLVAHGAGVNAISDDNRTPLMIAAGSPAGLPIVKLLLEHGANVNPTRHPDTESSPLAQATLAASPAMMQLLIDHKADIKASAVVAMVTAFDQNCRKCVDVLMKHDLDKDVYTAVLQQIAYFSDAATVRTLLDRGAKVDEPDPLGHTPLAYAAGSDLAPADVIKLLIERGASVNSKSPHKLSGDTGMSVLDIAHLRGETPAVAALKKSGASAVIEEVKAPAPQPASSIRAAIERSIPLLQRSDIGFASKSGCISCHSDSLPETAVAMARTHGFRVDQAMLHQETGYNLSNLKHNRDLSHQGSGGGAVINDNFVPHIYGYQLIALQAENYPADLDTDAAAMYIKSRQLADGSWPYPPADTRPPLCADYLGNTALSMRGLQLYPPAGQRAEYEKAVVMAAAWLAKMEPHITQDYFWKLIGLAWAGRDHAAIGKARRDLLALQRADGSWGDLPAMPSSAFTTGEALVALQTSGLPVSDAAYRHGVDYLLKTQQADGSWFVRTRALGFQPFFETGFPHGTNQSISSAATSWATMALILGLPAQQETIARK